MTESDSHTDPAAAATGEATTGSAGDDRRITTEQVAKVANLARLKLSDEELERFTGQLADILGHASDIEALDLSGVEAMAHPIPLSNVMRADEPGATLERDEVLTMAPAVEDHQFRVPPSIGEEA